MFYNSPTSILAVIWGAILLLVFIVSLFSYLGRRSKYRMLERLAEKGQTLSPEMLASLGSGLHLVESCTEGGEPAEAERVRLGVVVAVVERDERGLAGAAGEVDDTHERVRHDLVGCASGSRGGLGHRAHASLPSKFGFSQMTVPPMPRPMHMVVSP